MDSATLLDAIEFLGKEPLVQGMDIVEIDPTLDFRDMTSRVAAQVIMSFLLARRRSGKRFVYMRNLSILLERFSIYEYY